MTLEVTTMEETTVAGVRPAVLAIGLAAVLLAALLPVVGAGAATPGPTPLWRASCAYTRSAQVDPIVSPGKPSMHLHDFFGTAPTANSTYLDLRSSATTCKVLEETAGYWTPSLYTPGPGGAQVRRIPIGAVVYYSTPSGTKASPFPPNLKVIAGNGKATAPQPLNRVSFDCGADSAHTATPRLCGPGRHVRGHVIFPSCWDGVAPGRGDDSAHMTYRHGRQCPAGWTRVPQVHLIVNYGIRDGRGARLASGGGPTNPASIYTYHADFFQAWDQSVLSELVTSCLNNSNGSTCGTPASPRLLSLSPVSGAPGTIVTIRGWNLARATAVRFAGVPATFTRVSNAMLKARVPAGATTGPVSVTTDGGTGHPSVALTGSSRSPFHPRIV